MNFFIQCYPASGVSDSFRLGEFCNLYIDGPDQVIRCTLDSVERIGDDITVEFPLHQNFWYNGQMYRAVYDIVIGDMNSVSDLDCCEGITAGFRRDMMNAEEPIGDPWPDWENL